jgi:hypothetical protein
MTDPAGPLDRAAVVARLRNFPRREADRPDL